MQKVGWTAVAAGFRRIAGSRRVHEALLGVAAMLVISVLYFSTSLGEVLQQSDMRQGIANGQEAKEFFEATGEKSCWTNSLFSGMPTFQIAPSYSSSSLMSWAQGAYGLWLPSPANLLFMMMAGFYILMLAFGMRWYLALLGAVGYGFSSYFFIIIGAGHIWKFCVLAYIPPTIAGIVLCYRGRLLSGGALTAFFAMLQIASNHVQMTYYFLFVVAAMAVAYLADSLRRKTLRQWVKASGVLAVAALLAVAANLTSLYNTYEYSKETIRGRSTELVPKIPAGEESHNVNANGINRDAVTSWSYGVDETLTLIIPNVKGGATVKPNDVDGSGGLVAASVADLPGVEDAVGKVVLSDKPEENEYLKSELLPMVGQFRQYFGDQPMTNGPVYVGVLVFALFVLGLFVVKGPMKWALFAVTILSLLLSWGHNFYPLTYWMIDHFPMYDKFRAPASILVIAEFTMPLLAVLAVGKMLSTEDFFGKHRRAVYVSFGIPMFFCLLGAVAPSAFGSGLSASETEMLNDVAAQTSGVEQAFYVTAFNIVKDARLSMVAADSLRSLLFLAAGIALLLLFFKGKMNAKAFSLLLLAVVAADLFAVGKRYLNADMFVPKPTGSGEIVFEPTAADRQILQDTTDYRVMDVLHFGSATPSYFHKSIGGYHAAKLTRYNDLIARQIDPAKNDMISVLQKTGEVKLPERGMGVLNMLNTKYLIFGDSYVAVNPGALGNAWFAGRISYVKGADAEMDALGRIDPASEAVADGTFRSVLGDAKSVVSGDTIYETLYRPNELHYKSVSRDGGIAVFSEIYFPWGWTATVDGKETSIGRVNYVLRALQVPAGAHDIVFRFDPQSIHSTETAAYTSIIIIYLALAAALAALAVRYGTKRRKEQGEH